MRPRFSKEIAHNLTPRSTPREIPLDWGHPLMTPDGRIIRIPNVFEFLKDLDLIVRDRATGLPRLRPIIYEYLQSDYDSLLVLPKNTVGSVSRGRATRRERRRSTGLSLRQILGTDLSGPEAVCCNCGECIRKVEDADRTPMPRQRAAHQGR